MDKLSEIRPRAMQDLKAQRTTKSSGDLRHDLVGCGGVQIRDDDPRTGIDERQHDRTAKAARSACHDRDSAVDSRPQWNVVHRRCDPHGEEVERPSTELGAVRRNVD
jgi:hypothetical protein